MISMLLLASCLASMYRTDPDDQIANHSVDWEYLQPEQQEMEKTF
jgi:hypothetical protein